MADCPLPEDLVAIAAGEEGAAAAHIADCAQCQAELAALHRLFAELRQDQDVPADYDILIQPQLRTRHPALWWLAAAAALLLTGAVVLWPRSQPDAVERAGHWLGTHLTEAPHALGGQARFSPALRGLAVLAMLGHAPQAAAEALLRPLPKSTSPQAQLYNQGIHALALVEAYGATEDPRLRGPIQEILETIQRSQQPDGSWGYDAAPASPASVSIWHIRALQRAADTGWLDVQPALMRGLDWARQARSSQQSYGYTAAAQKPGEMLYHSFCLGKTSGPLEPTDYYSAYLYTVTAKAEHTSEVRAHLAARQQNDGSWPADDRWSHVGGRLYATAMATLTLATQQEKYGPQ